jgi:hypothetical protein
MNPYVERVTQVWWVRMINGVAAVLCLDRCFRRLGVLQITPESLIRTSRKAVTAIEATNLEEGAPLLMAGHEDTPAEKLMMKYKEPLSLMCADIAGVDLTFVGKIFLHFYHVRCLNIRLRVLQYIREHYFDLNRQQIRRPIFVVGLPRTGTTLAFNLLCSDPNHRFATNWQAESPTLSELRARASGGTATNFVVIGMNPLVKTVHEFNSDLPEECLVITAGSMLTYMNLILCFMPQYYDYMFNKADVSGMYRFHKYVLQILQYRYPSHLQDGGERTWVLKSPQHLAFLETLLQMYPDACIVWTHRSPEHAISSTASLFRNFHVLSHRTLDNKGLGKIMTDTLSDWLARACVVRNNPKYAKNFYDLSYQELVKDPAVAMRRLYEHFDLPYTEATVGAHQNCLKRMPQGKFGKHKYSAEQFGLTTQSIREACDVYVKQYAGIL